jgi:hypothetical protein
MRRPAFAIVVAVVVTVLAVSPAAAQEEPRFRLALESAGIWQNRNDVRIPPDTGTEFSISDLIGAGPSSAVRAEVTAALTERQQVRLVYAPLRVTGSGVPTDRIEFAGSTFTAEAIDAEYQFSSYRATYRFRIVDGDTWRWWLGFTAFVRDARIALEQAGISAEDTDLGFVPLGHLAGTARLSDRWRFDLDLDFAAAPQGRALDLATLLRYEPTPRWHVAFGYRTIEGGADVDQVYTFAWINAAVVRVGVGF